MLRDIAFGSVDCTHVSHFQKALYTLCSSCKLMHTDRYTHTSISLTHTHTHTHTQRCSHTHNMHIHKRNLTQPYTTLKHLLAIHEQASPTHIYSSPPPTSSTRCILSSSRAFNRGVLGRRWGQRFPSSLKRWAFVCGLANFPRPAFCPHSPLCTSIRPSEPHGDVGVSDVWLWKPPVTEHERNVEVRGMSVEVVSVQMCVRFRSSCDGALMSLLVNYLGLG